MLRLKSQTRFWALAFGLFALLLWLLKPVLLPFLTGMAIAYFLNPVVDLLAKRKVPRWVGSLVVLLCFVIVVTLISILMLPLLENQIGALLNAIPGYIEKFRNHVLPWIDDWLSRFAPEDVDKLRDAASQSVGEAAGWVGKALQQIVTSGVALIDIIALTIITPVVAFYMLRDWPKLTKAIDGFLPRRHYKVIHTQMMEVDTTLSGFIRGQALVCLSLGAIYTIGLSIAGLHYGAAIGVTAGILSFIPYVGTAFGWISSLLLATAQFDSLTRILMVAAVFLFGHFMEAYVLTPRLVGKRVGLHPVWILFALIAGAKLLGFSGVLIAVPTAAVLGVLVRFALAQYKSSTFYKDPLAPNKS